MVWLELNPHLLYLAKKYYVKALIKTKLSSGNQFLWICLVMNMAQRIAIWNIKGVNDKEQELAMT